jgi:dihydrofolate synthase/folylpolyglutamate synthase
MYTSPHLQDIRERFNINGRMVDQATLATAVEHLAPIFAAVEGARFPEIMATLALYLFAQHSVDAAVVEVSVGGRLDATNVVYPTVSVITSISYDHVHLLGKTLKDIAWEKGGIIKPGIPAVSAPQAPEAADELARVAAERGAPFTLIGRDVRFWAHEMQLITETPREGSGQGVTLWMDGKQHIYTTALLGAHQAINAAVAVTALRQLKPVGIVVNEESIHQGLRSVFWAGRLEVVSHNPLILLDSAHNPESAVKLREAIEQLFPQHPRVLVFGAKTTKDISGTLQALLPIADHVVLTRSHDGMTDNPLHLAEVMRALNGLDSKRQGGVNVEGDLGAAMAKARMLAGIQGMVCITGSMFLVGEARTRLGLQPQ